MSNSLSAFANNNEHDEKRQSVYHRMIASEVQCNATLFSVTQIQNASSWLPHPGEITYTLDQ